MEMSFEKFKEYCCMQLICKNNKIVCCEDGNAEGECKEVNCPVFKGEENATI